LEACDHFGAGLLIGPHDGAQVFGVELAREASRIHQVAEQHRELAAFGVRRMLDVGYRDTEGAMRFLESRRRRTGGRMGYRRWGHPSTRAWCGPDPQRAAAPRRFPPRDPGGRHRRAETGAGGPDTTHGPGAGAWRSPGRGSPQRSTPTLPRPMRRAADGVRISKATWTYVYRKW